MTVRAKFKVQSITRRPGWNGNKEVQEIKLFPVVADSEENKKFYAATPSGEINLTTVNFDIGSQFDIGEEFYVDFTKA